DARRSFHEELDFRLYGLVLRNTICRLYLRPQEAGLRLEKLTSSIKFGTSGWRGLIARDFTFENVRLATQGIALWLEGELADSQSAFHGRKSVVILGFDSRFIVCELWLASAEGL